MKKHVWKQALIAISILMTTAWVAACQDDEEAALPGVAYGPEVNVGNGTARSFVRLDETGAPTAIGFTMTRTALDNLPHEGAHKGFSYLLALPAEKAQTPYDHISLDWMPHGHVPEGVYNVPHFDMHFYMVSQEERAEIQPGTPEMEKLPDTRFLPPNYLSTPGEGEPQMGKHWVDVTSPELQGQPFTTTFIYGSYDGHVIFHEPMMAHAWLAAEPDTVITLPQPEAVERSGFYPGKYSVTFDDEQQLFIISLDELTRKNQPATIAGQLFQGLEGGRN